MIRSNNFDGKFDCKNQVIRPNTTIFYINQCKITWVAATNLKVIIPFESLSWPLITAEPTEYTQCFIKLGFIASQTCEWPKPRCDHKHQGDFIFPLGMNFNSIVDPYSPVNAIILYLGISIHKLNWIVSINFTCWKNVGWTVKATAIRTRKALKIMWKIKSTNDKVKTKTWTFMEVKARTI